MEEVIVVFNTHFDIGYTDFAESVVKKYGSSLIEGALYNLEASMEVRLNLLQGDEDGWLTKLWMVQFLDAGNVWQLVDDFQFKKVAIATGLGIRYDTFVGPFRLDWGIRIYDPGAPEGRQWITQRKFWSETVANSVFHLGIGQAF